VHGLAPAPKFHAPKPFKLPSPPKIRAIHIRPLTNGLKVTHHMSGGTSKVFTFTAPNKMLSHLRRIQNTEWLKPMHDPAPQMVHALNLGETP